MVFETRRLRRRQPAFAAQRGEPCGERVVARRAAEQIAVAQPHVGIGFVRMRGDPVAQRREPALGLARVDPLRADRGQHVGIVGRARLRVRERRGEGRPVAAAQRDARVGQRRFGVELACERAHAVRALRVGDAGERRPGARDVVDRVAVQRARIAHFGRIGLREAVVHHRAAELRQAHVAIQPRQRETRPRLIGRRAHRGLVALRGRAALALVGECARLGREQVGTQPVERATVVAAGHAALQRVEQRPDALGAPGVLIKQRGVAHDRHARRTHGEQLAQQRLRTRPVALREQRIGQLQLRVGAVGLHRERGARRALRVLRPAGRGRCAALGEQAPELRGAREALPLAALIGCGQRRSAREQRTRFVMPSFAQPQQPEAAERIGVVGPGARGAREQRIGAGQIAAGERLQAALLRDVVGIAFELALRVALLVELGRAVVEFRVVRHQFEISVQRVQIREIGARGLQYVPPDVHRFRMVGVRALRERPCDPVRLRARLGALVQQPRERHRRVDVLRIGRDPPTQRGERRFAAARRIREDLVILGAERARRRAVRKQRDDAARGFVRAAAAGEQANLRHLAAAARRDAVFVGRAARVRRRRCARLQARERGLGAFRIAEPQQHAHLLGEQARIVRCDQQPLAQRIARKIVAMFVAPHARGRQQALRVRAIGRAQRRGRLGRHDVLRRSHGDSGGGRHGRTDRRREPREPGDARRRAFHRAAHGRPSQRASSVPSAPNR